MIKIDQKTIVLEGTKLLIQAEALALLKVLAKKDWLDEVIAAYIIVTEDEEDSTKQWEQDFQDWRNRYDPKRPLHNED